MDSQFQELILQDPLNVQGHLYKQMLQDHEDFWAPILAAIDAGTYPQIDEGGCTYQDQLWCYRENAPDGQECEWELISLIQDYQDCLTPDFGVLAV